MYLILIFIISLIFFLLSIYNLSKTIKNLYFNKLSTLLNKCITNTYITLLLSILITSIIQSSSAIIVLTISLVNTKVIHFKNSIPIIMGANIGTTTTPFIFMLNNINIFKTSYLMYIFIIIGLLLIIKKYKIGYILFYIGTLFLSMFIMEKSISSLFINNNLFYLLSNINNPTIAFTSGIIFTSIIQSSSASIVLLQLLSSLINFKLNIIIPLILGQNIGTCSTSLLSSLSLNKSHYKPFLFHLLFNILGSIFILLIIYLFNLYQLNITVSNLFIALFHLLFNILTTLLLLPFINKIENLINKLL